METSGKWAWKLVSSAQQGSRKSLAGGQKVTCQSTMRKLRRVEIFLVFVTSEFLPVCVAKIILK
jgi:hypothetical protein